ncbi:MAG: S-layer homology domain-containing protein [Clostridia bacterium]|nr:S-layer homology domain-containing protein [Clostridia bacterium]
MKKRVFSIILCVVMAISIAMTSGAEDSFEAAPYGQEIQVLQDLGIVVAGEGQENGNSITRAEFAAVVMRAVGYGELASAGTADTVAYTDVPENHWAYSYIMYGTKFGFFRGVSETEFAPDEEVRMDQAVSVCVNMIGYGRMAEAQGGYPAGHLSVASSKKLLNGVRSTDSSKPARRSDVYRMIYNTIHADMLIYTSIGSELTYEVYRDRNLLTENHGIYQMNGVVTADDTLAIEGSKTDKAGTFRLQGIEIDSELPQSKGKVGRNVKCYYKTDGNELYQAVAIYDRDNNIVTLTPDNVLQFDYGNGIYQVNDGSRKTNLYIGSHYALVYNGDRIEISDKTMMQPSTGSITLIDNNTDGTYDVIFVEEYYNLLVGSYDAYKNILYDKKPEEPVPGEKFERNAVLERYRTIEGNVNPEKLATGTIVSVYKSPSKEKIRMEASSQTVTGCITSTYSDANGNFLEIDGTAYKVSGDARFAYESLSAGSDVKLVLDAMGLAAYAELSVGQKQGYFIEFKASAGMEPCWTNVLLSSGKVRDYALRSKVRLETSQGSESIADKEVARRIGQYGRGLMLFETDDQQQISKIILPWEINTAEEYANLPQYPILKMNYLLEAWPNKTSQKTFKRYINGFENWLIFDQNAMIYTVPGEQESYDKDNVSVTGIDTFEDNARVSVPVSTTAARVVNNIDVYKVGNSSPLPNIMIHYAKATAAIVEDREPAVVSKITKVVDEKEGVPTTALTLIAGGREAQYQMIDSGLLVQNGVTVQVGDIVKYGLDSNGKITSLQLHYSSKIHENLYNAATSFNSSDIIYRLACGTVTRAEGTYFEVELQNGANKKVERYLFNNMRAVVCDMRWDKTIKTGSTADIAVGDKVVLYSRYLQHKMAVIYKEGNE